MLSLHGGQEVGVRLGMGLYLYNPPVNDCVSVIIHSSPSESRNHLLDGYSGEHLQCVRVCAQDSVQLPDVSAVCLGIIVLVFD